MIVDGVRRLVHRYLGWVLLQAAALAASRIPTTNEMLYHYGIGLDRSSLIAALENTNPGVRTLAAFKLTADGDKSAAPFIMRALQTEPDLKYKIHFELYVAELGDQTGAVLLQRTCADRSLSDRLRIEASEDMLLLGSVSCFPTVMSILAAVKNPQLTHDLLYLVARYFSIVGDVQKGNIMTVATEHLRNASPPVRTAASSVVAMIGDESQVSVLEDAIYQEPDSSVRSQMQGDLRALLNRLQR